MIILLSVPHTGTRFAMKYLNTMGIIYRQYHTSPSEVDNVRHENATKALVPVRDPLLAYTSRWLRVNSKDSVLKEVVLNYKLLLEMESWFTDVQYLNLNTEDREAELKAAADFCGYEGDAPSFEWEPVGSLKPNATDYTIWDIVSEQFEPGEKEQVLEALAPYREHYGY